MYEDDIFTIVKLLICCVVLGVAAVGCCYRILDDGGKKYYKFEMDKTTIYDTLESGEQAYVDVTTNGVGMVISYDLYVPQDSIIKEVDLSIPQ